MRALSALALSGVLLACSDHNASSARVQPAMTTQPGQHSTLSIERVFASPGLSGPTPRGLTMAPDGSRVTFLLPKESDHTTLDLWAMDVADGRRYRLVDARALQPQARELSEAEIQYRERARISEGGVVSYQWDEAGTAILVPLDGSLFYVDVTSGSAKQLTDGESFVTDAKVSPDGRYVSFIREQNLWLHDLASGEERALTTEGGGTISWGVAEFVAQEEMKRHTGYWWSPTGERLVVARVDESTVDVIPRFGINADSVSVTEQRYPRAGRPNALVSLWLLDRRSGAFTAIDLGPDTDIYVANVHWSKDGSSAYVERQNRAQTELDLLAVADDGSTRVLLTERANTWVNLSTDFTALSDGSFLWSSERAGYRHLYHVDGAGEQRAVTSGDWVVDRLSGVSEDGQTLYFEGWVETPLERHLYSVPWAGGEPQRISSGAGRWQITLARGGRGFVGIYADPLTPPNAALYQMNGDRIAWIEENRLDAEHPYAAYQEYHVAPEFGTLTADDGSVLHWSLLRPPHCSAESPCPAVVQVYGGPGVQTVTRDWVSPRDQLFPAHGYALFKLDNRGSSNRGHRFEAALHRRMGQPEVADQLLGLKFLQSLDFVDAERIGLWGWSYGGYMTLMTSLQAPGAFRAAVSGAPVTDWSLYDTHYTERYMGTPQNNPEGYAQGSVFTHIDGHRTPLLLIHGMADDNVTFDHSTRLYSALQTRGELFEIMTYPGERHGVRPPPLQTHLWRTILRFFERELGG